MALSIERAINDLTYTDSDNQTMGGVIDQFNGLIYGHTKYVGPALYPQDRQLRMFTMAIAGETKFSTILDIAFTNKWNLDSLQARLRIKEVQLNPHNHEDLTGVQQRRQDPQKYGRMPE